MMCIIYVLYVRFLTLCVCLQSVQVYISRLFYPKIVLHFYAFIINTSCADVVAAAVFSLKTVCV